MINFNKRLKTLRKEKKKTQEDVAEVLGVKRATYSGYERGVIMPPYNKITALADYFGVSVEDLTGTESSQGPPADVSETISNLLGQLQDKNSPIALDGVLLDDESRDLLISSLDSSLKMGRIIAKRKDEQR